MKKQLLFMAFIAFVAMNFIACSSDETANEQTQLKLSAGITAQKEPYDINDWGTNIDIGDIDASTAKESKVKVDKALTRNTVDNDNWVGMNNRDIAVQAGGLVYQYEVDASGNLTSNTPYYFTTTSNVSVASWYPYSASLGTFAVQTDQTSFANYEKSDLLYATTTVNQSSPSASLTYTHKTAKLIFRVTINNSQYLYDPTINGVTLSNVYYKGNVSNGNITATDKGTIKMYNVVASSTSGSNVTTATFEACVVPQTSAISYTVAYGAGTYSGALSSATLQAGYVYTCDITMNVLQYADMGLPSGVKWARLNVGASKATDYGGFYMWGGLTDLAENTSSDFYSAGRSITPTCGHDTAYELCGHEWRMPSRADVNELNANATFSWERYDGVRGILVTSTINGNTFFLPASGRWSGDGKTHWNEGTYGWYWISNMSSNGAGSIFALYGTDNLSARDVSTGHEDWGDVHDRDNVRPVSN